MFALHTWCYHRGAWERWSESLEIGDSNKLLRWNQAGSCRFDIVDIMSCSEHWEVSSRSQDETTWFLVRNSFTMWTSFITRYNHRLRPGQNLTETGSVHLDDRLNHNRGANNIEIDRPLTYFEIGDLEKFISRKFHENSQNVNFQDFS